MTTISFATPILPGKLETWRRFNQETLGTMAEGHDALNQRAGVTRELAWLQQTPEGDMAIIFMEVSRPDQLFAELATSDDPYAAWFRQQTLDIHGLDLTQIADAPMPELAFNWSA